MGEASEPADAAEIGVREAVDVEVLERSTIEDRVTSRNPLEEASAKLGEVREVNRRARVRAEGEALQSVELVDPRDVVDLQIDDLKLSKPGQLNQER
jgi:hypothetical protein